MLLDGNLKKLQQLSLRGLVLGMSVAATACYSAAVMLNRAIPVPATCSSTGGALSNACEAFPFQITFFLCCALTLFSVWPLIVETQGKWSSEAKDELTYWDCSTIVVWLAALCYTTPRFQCTM